MHELAARFGEAEALTGVLTSPVDALDSAELPAFIFLNSGILHRVGPNRLSVTMARELAELGFTSFRMDLSGIGDSLPTGGGASIGERWTSEVRTAMDYLGERTGASEFVVVGNCSGARVGLLTALADSRVAGAVLINLQGPRTYLRYYFRVALTTGAFWRRLLGGTGRFRDVRRAVQGALGSKKRRATATAERQGVSAFDLDGALDTLSARGTQLLLVYSGLDPALDFFRLTLRPKLAEKLQTNQFETEIIPGVNHNLVLLASQTHLRDRVRSWAAGLRTRSLRP